jgi:capping protein (actin filament) muscle Z-line, alpha
MLLFASYDHLRKEASQYRPAPEPDRRIEQWRSALESAFTAYVKDYYKFGVTTVYGSTHSDGDIMLIACIESHQFSPKNFW